MNMDKVYEAVSAEIDTGKGCEAASAEIDVEKVREAALVHYEDLTKDQQQAAKSFFQAMDKDKSGNISIDEFITFLSLAEFETENHDSLFAELDKDNNGTLSFKELVTFFYVLSQDEYRNRLNRRSSADVPGRKAKFGRRTVEASDQGQRWNMGEFSRLYGKLKGVYKIGDYVNENACTIL